MKVCVTELEFFEKTFFAPKIGKCAENRVFEFKEILKEIEFKLIFT